jgi:hypothetical protein
LPAVAAISASSLERPLALVESDLANGYITDSSLIEPVAAA